MRVRIRLETNQTGMNEAKLPFMPQMAERRPRWPGFATSLAIHAAAISMLATMGPEYGPTKPQTSRISEFEIRIGDKLYYVSRLPAGTEAGGAKGASSSRGGGGSAAAKLQAPAAARRAPARAWVAPKTARVKPPVNSILYQPLIDPQIEAEEIPLPNLAVWTRGPKLPPKPLVVPGTRAVAPGNPQVLATPEGLAVAGAVPAHGPPQLSVAQIAQGPPVEVVAPPSELGAASELPGDSVRVLSASRFPVAPGGTIRIPQGNILPNGSAGAGTGAGGGGGNGAGNSAGAERSGGGETASAGGSGGGRGIAGGVGSGGGTAATGKGTSGGSGTSGNGTGGTAAGLGGTGPAGPAVAAALPAGSARTDIDATFAKIIQPPTGKFDAIVVQSVPLEIIEDSTPLLTGRPVYTVYLAMGTPKDWILQYCVPRESVAKISPSGNVVRISTPAPLTAPWPTFMVRPPVVVRPGEKYMVVHGLLNDTGKVERVRVVRSGSDDTDARMMVALRSWEFRPAMKDGQPVTVEFLLAVPPDRI